MPTNHTSEDLLRIAEQAGVIADKGIHLSRTLHAQLPSGTPDADLRSRSIHFVAVAAHDLELGFRVVREMLFSSIWDLLYHPNGPTMYPGAKINADHFQSFVQRSAFLTTFTIMESHFRAVHRALAPGELGDATDSWWKIWTSLESKLGGFSLPEDRNLIRIMATVRNCIHNNGVHREKDDVIPYRGLRYSFDNGVDLPPEG